MTLLVDLAVVCSVRPSASLVAEIPLPCTKSGACPEKRGRASVSLPRNQAQIENVRVRARVMLLQITPRIASAEARRRSVATISCDEIMNINEP